MKLTVAMRRALRAAAEGVVVVPHDGYTKGRGPGFGIRTARRLVDAGLATIDGRVMALTDAGRRAAFEALAKSIGDLPIGSPGGAQSRSAIDIVWAPFPPMRRPTVQEIVEAMPRAAVEAECNRLDPDLVRMIQISPFPAHDCDCCGPDGIRCGDLAGDDEDPCPRCRARTEREGRP